MARRRNRYIEKAEKVSIVSVLQDLFGIEAAWEVEGFKTSCPLGHEHSDGGRSEAMRVYPESNTAWCFSHSEKFSPLSLAMLHFSMGRIQAAKELLKHYDISPYPPSPSQRWASLESDMLNREADTDILRELFLTYVRQLPGYGKHQYDSDVVEVVSAILRTADNLPVPPTEKEIDKWVQKARKVMEVLWQRKGLDSKDRSVV